ncbi:hypothetical protein [Gluconobacter oxydans]|uniref:hypothetical protein n=2 Tax=Acetobacteraceae TaxID=433 RepID=UPI0009C00163|nr:hypothetical protein [Gluconobacter oxydans]
MERQWRFPEPILPSAKTVDGTGRQARSVLSKGGWSAADAGSRAALQQMRACHLPPRVAERLYGLARRLSD